MHEKYSWSWKYKSKLHPMFFSPPHDCCCCVSGWLLLSLKLSWVQLSKGSAQLYCSSLVCQRWLEIWS